MSREITVQERAAIYYHLVGRCDDWYQLYRIAKGDEALNKLSSDEVKAASVSRWKKSEAMQKAIKEVRCILDMEKNEIEAKAVETYKEDPEDAEVKQDVNFLDRDEFLRYLNKQANRIQDEKSRNETLKMISDNLRYKDMDREKEGDEDIMRFYVPITCSECPLYLQEKEAINKESEQ